MAKFESVVSGNIATTPIKGANTIMSPTEVAAFEQPASQAASEPVADNAPQWELVTSEPLPANNFGITTSGVRQTCRMEVPGGYLYAVSTWYVSYVRGVADTSVSETLTFVPSAKSKK
jgi:hypothetical protein